MFTFFDMEVYKYDWMAVFEQDGQITKIHNDKSALERFLSSVQMLVGYNNYNYDDKIVASILKNMDPYNASQKIISNKRFGLRLNKPLTLDVMQELRGVSLKEAQANLGYNIIETPIDFNIDRQLSKKELEQVFKYCENDVLITKRLFEERKNYFTSKFEIVQEFKLPATSLKKTNANLAADVLEAKKTKGADDKRLILKYDNRLQKHELPKPVVEFYKNVQNMFEGDASYQELEREKFTFKLAGLEHVYGFGGLHAAKENYVDEGQFMQIDVKSYYPTLLINNSFLEDKALERYEAIYKGRQKLKKFNDSKEESYKLILNIVYGGLKSPWNKLYNPQVANNIVVNGQLILTHLIVLLDNFCELIQTNTDGLIIKYDEEMKPSILKLIKLFEEHYSLKFDIDYINKLAQRDVNNYVVRYDDGRLNAKGRFANYDGGNFERNSLTIIDKALVDYYINGIKTNKTVINTWRKNELEFFQYVTKAGKFDGMAQEIRQDTLFDVKETVGFKELKNVNRIFAGKDERLGAVYKTKKEKETKYTKVPYTSDNCFVFNDDLKKLNKRKIDLNWYIKEVEKWLL